MPVSMLEKCAEEVANDVLPKAEAGPGPNDTPADADRGFDISMIITLVMTIMQTFIQNCPQPAPAVKRLFKRSERRHDAALLKVVKSNCDCMGLGRFTGPIFQSLKARATALPDPDATALIKECADDRNLLL